MNSMLGKKSWRLTVISENEKIGMNRGKPRNAVKVLCDCGNVFVTRRDAFISGHTKSCGCLHKDLVSISSARQHITHGCGGVGGVISPTYLAWQKIKSCVYKGWKRGAHKNCHEMDIRWNKFENFLADFGEIGPTETVARKDANLTWSKENCFVANGRRIRPAPKISRPRRIVGASIAVAMEKLDCDAPIIARKPAPMLEMGGDTESN